MRRLAPLAPLVLVAACTDPVLNVQFTIPGRYNSEVKSSTLRIVEPPPAEPFDCDAIAFSRLAPDVLRLSTTLEVTARSSDAVPLADLDRLSSKLLLADGLDASGDALVRGCLAVGEVDAVLDAEIIGEPIAVLTAITETATAAPGVLTPPVILEVRDRRGQSLADIQGRWQITGAGGDGESGEVTSDENGRLTIQPHAPAQPGPFTLSTSVRWGTTGRTVVSGAATPSGETVTLPGRALAYRAGRIGPLGEPGIVALISTGSMQTEVVFLYREGGQFVQRRSMPLGNGTVLGILEELRDPPTSGRDRVIVLTAGREWLEVSPDGTFTREPLAPPGLGFGRPTAMVSATECRVGAPPRAMVGFDDGFLGVYGGTGVKLDGHFVYLLSPTNFPLDPLASGCLDIEGSGPIRTYVLSPRSLPLYVLTERNPTDIVVGGFIALTAGISFVPPSKANVGQLIGTQIDGNDFVLGRVRGRVEGTGNDEVLNLIPVGSDAIPAAFQPLSTTAGDLDGDGKLDVVSLFGRVSAGGGPAEFQIWSYLALEVAGQRIAGPLVDDLPAFADPELLLIDIDRDTIPDIVVGDRPAVGETVTRMEIFRLGG